jgi:general stress protein YciG
MTDMQYTKFQKTMIKKHGSYEAWREHMRQNGIKGGKSTYGYEFAHGRLTPQQVGSLGGKAKARNRSIIEE